MSKEQQSNRLLRHEDHLALCLHQSDFGGASHKIPQPENSPSDCSRDIRCERHTLEPTIMPSELLNLFDH